MTLVLHSISPKLISPKFQCTSEGGEKVSIHDHIVRLARLIPFARVMTMGILLLTGNGCGKGLFPELTSSVTNTSTATAQATAFVYASNFNDGNVSEFRRGTNGALTFL